MRIVQKTAAALRDYLSGDAFEVQNPSFSDMTLNQQIAAGVNDWCAERADGHPFFGETKAKAEAARAAYA